MDPGPDPTPDYTGLDKSELPDEEDPYDDSCGFQEQCEIQCWYDDNIQAGGTVDRERVCEEMCEDIYECGDD